MYDVKRRGKKEQKGPRGQINNQTPVKANKTKKKASQVLTSR